MLRADGNAVCEPNRYQGEPEPPPYRPLQHKVLAAKKAIGACGFKSGKFKTQKGSIRMDMTVPITFDQFEDPDAMMATVLKTLADAAGVQVSIPKTFIAKSPNKFPGRPRKSWKIEPE